jgi:dTDP-4-amino-4,6-dideoxygalactose transaminase
MIPISVPDLRPEDYQAVLDVLKSGSLTQGPRIEALESSFAEICGVEHAVAVSSGTAALYLALKAHGIGPEDEVITSPFSFIATANCILWAGAVPVFVDILDDTFNLDPAKIEPAITENTRAVLVVHLYGQPCEMDAIRSIVERHNLVLIEDACQAVGATFSGQPVGSFGTGCFSLYATKNIMTGEGGVITTDDADIAQLCRQMRNHGAGSGGDFETLGYNFRMSDIHAALGVEQSKRISGLTKARREHAAFFNEHLHSVTTPVVRAGCEHVWHQYIVKLRPDQNRDETMDFLLQSGIQTRIYYEVPLHRYAHIAGDAQAKPLPIAERVAGEVLSLPVHPLLTERDLEWIVEKVNQI